MATLKHISSKNADYGAAERYLTFEHDEFSGKAVRDKHGHLVPREEYRMDTLLCGEEDFAIACMKAAGISIIKPHTRSATPMPAEGIRPRLFTIASRTRNEIPTRRS